MVFPLAETASSRQVWLGENASGPYEKRVRLLPSERFLAKRLAQDFRRATLSSHGHHPADPHAAHAAEHQTRGGSAPAQPPLFPWNPYAWATWALVASIS